MQNDQPRWEMYTSNNYYDHICRIYPFHDYKKDIGENVYYTYT